MGFSLSYVLDCFFQEFLESKPFEYILPNDSHYFRYIDNVLIIYPNKYNIHFITNKLNQTEPTINFIYELEKKQNNSLPFLNILLINNSNKLKFRVYQKANSKNDYINFYSNNINKIKSSILIGFFSSEP